MKRFLLNNVFVILLIINTSVVFSQENNQMLQVGKSKVFIEGNLTGYEFYKSSYQISNQWDKERNKIIQLQKEYLESESKINPKADHPKFEMPVRLNDFNSDPGFYSLTSYVDHDTLFPEHLLDYQCGDLTYDLENGYNHTGTDFFLWPFPWYKMYHDEVEIVAAAPGILFFKQDGNNDQQCELNNDPTNGVAIIHEDGSAAWYVHMKKNSVTNKNVGEEIEKGEYLGIVGSSGSSLSPHFHFEVFDAGGYITDPFYGPCNDKIDESWWLDQIPYKEPGINRIATNNHLPFFPECPGEEVTNEADVFYPGDSIFLLSYFRNISLNDQIEVIIYRPDNSVFASWDWNSPWEFYSASWLFFLMFLEEEEFGVWKYNINYKDVLYEHYFQLKDPQGVESSSNMNRLEIYPVPSNEYITINLDIKEPYQIEILNRIGVSVYTQDVQFNSGNPKILNISHLLPGIYIVKIKTTSNTLLSKIIKL